MLQPELINLYQASSLLPGHYPIVASCQFKFTILAPLQWADQTLSSFGFPTFPILPLLVLPLAGEPCPIILLHLF
jgi:hypothetical protein